MNVKWNLGDWNKAVELPVEYFEKRGCFIDRRGPLSIANSSTWGFGVIVLTESHDILSGICGPVVPYGVKVAAEAWICSRVLLCGCSIGERAIVAAGAVVRGQDVAPGVMVAGNPARVIARWNGAGWDYLSAAETGYSRRLE